MSTFFLNILPASATSSGIVHAQESDESKEEELARREERIRKKEKELEEKEASLKKLEQELKPLKELVDTRTETLNELNANLVAYAEKLSEREKALKDAKIDHLVKIYSSMDAKNAAESLNKLNIDTKVRILGNMKGKPAGLIMAEMPAEKSAEISEKLSKSK